MKFYLFFAEEFDGNNQFHPDIPSGMKQQKMNNDVSNTAPSVEEASTRFGVSLRKREPSTDSCSSLGSPANDLNEAFSKTSPFNDVPNKSIDPASMLVSELAETMQIPKPEAPIKPSELIRKQNTTTPKLTTTTTANNQNENQNGMSFKAQLKKVEPKRTTQETTKNEITTSIIDFKSRLRRVDQTDGNVGENSTSDEINNGKIINNKCASGDEITTTIVTTCNIINNNSNNNNNKIKPNSNNNIGGKDLPLKKTEIKIDVVDAKQPQPQSGSDDDDKRKSTGSISSLKKIWEAKEQVSGGGGEQLSPKNTKKDDDSHNNNNNGHHESSMDPPVAKKPAVPVKPSKFSIYATPIQNSQQGSVGNVKSAENNNHTTLLTNAMTSINSAAPASRDSILELVQLVE